jgi:hypothetical protein
LEPPNRIASRSLKMPLFTPSEVRKVGRRGLARVGAGVGAGVGLASGGSTNERGRLDVTRVVGGIDRSERACC